MKPSKLRLISENARLYKSAKGLILSAHYNFLTSMFLLLSTTYDEFSDECHIDILASYGVLLDPVRAHGKPSSRCAVGIL